MPGRVGTRVPTLYCHCEELATKQCMQRVAAISSVGRSTTRLGVTGRWMDRHAGKLHRLAMTTVFVIARSLRRSNPCDDHSQRRRSSNGGSVGVSARMGDWGIVPRLIDRTTCSIIGVAWVATPEIGRASLGPRVTASRG